MKIQQRHLPAKCHPNRRLDSIDGSVVHFISDRYRHPDDPFNIDHIVDLLTEFGFSYHWLIDRDGSVYELVPPHLEAWHAGRSRMNNRDHCNRFTHGIALVGGKGWEYTEDQIISLGQLTASDMSINQYTTDWIAGHEDVRRAWNNAHPDRADKPKPDPGELLPWSQYMAMLEGVDLAIRANDW